jgi:hypothetical protein
MLPLKNITPSLQIRFVISCNKDKSLKLNIHLGYIIDSVLETLKNNIYKSMVFKHSKIQS